MNRATWKAVERAIAKILGGQRIPITGRAEIDIDHPWLAIEVKARHRLPQWIEKAMLHAETGPPHKLPIVVLHEEGRDHRNDLVMMRLGDFTAWFGDETNE